MMFTYIKTVRSSVPRHQVKKKKPPLRGHILVKFENGHQQLVPIRASSPVMATEFQAIPPDNEPWDYEDPDGDGVFRR